MHSYLEFTSENSSGLKLSAIFDWSVFILHLLPSLFCHGAGQMLWLG